MSAGILKLGHPEADQASAPHLGSVGRYTDGKLLRHMNLQAPNRNLSEDSRHAAAQLHGLVACFGLPLAFLVAGGSAKVFALEVAARSEGGR